VSGQTLLYMVGTQLFLQLTQISWTYMVIKLCTKRINKLLIIKTAITVFIEKKNNNNIYISFVYETHMLYTKSICEWQIKVSKCNIVTSTFTTNHNSATDIFVFIILCQVWLIKKHYLLCHVSYGDENREVKLNWYFLIGKN